MHINTGQLERAAKKYGLTPEEIIKSLEKKFNIKITAAEFPEESFWSVCIPKPEPGVDVPGTCQSCGNTIYMDRNLPVHAKTICRGCLDKVQ